MMLVVHEHELIARPGIREAHAAWIAGGPPIGDPAHRALCGELRIGEREQGGEALGRQAGNSEVHDWPPSWLTPNMENRRSRTTRFLTAWRSERRLHASIKRLLLSACEFHGTPAAPRPSSRPLSP